MRKELRSFEELEELIRDWKSFKDQDIYDFVGMWTLFLACIENMKAHGLEAELREAAQAMSNDQRRFLQELLRP